MIKTCSATVLRSSLLGLALAATALAGCGGDDSGDGSSSGGSGSGGSGGSAPAAGTTGGSGSGGSSGTGSSGSGGAAGSSSGGTGGTTVAPVPCGTTMCEGTGSRFLRPCCFNEGEAKCGTMVAFGGMTCNENVDPDPRCESIMAMSITIPSCCTEDNRCGISFGMFGMPGCTSLEEAAMIAMGDGGTPDGGAMNPFAVDLPAPKACE